MTKIEAICMRTARKIPPLPQTFQNKQVEDSYTIGALVTFVYSCPKKVRLERENAFEK